jgi:hypothetical protein
MGNQEWTIKNRQSRMDNQEWTIKNRQSRMDNQQWAIKNGQSRMDNQETLATLGTQDTGRRYIKQKCNTAQKTKNLSPTRLYM